LEKGSRLLHLTRSRQPATWENSICAIISLLEADATVKVDADFVKNLCGIGGYKADKQRTLLTIMTLTKQAEPPSVYTLRYALIYIYLHHCHKGICRRKEPLVQIMDPEKSQCIQKNNTLEVKTSGLIV
jgi:hypothetical protein